MILLLTLTLGNIPPDLDAALRRKAEQEHRPLDQVAVEAMKVGLGMTKQAQATIGSSSLAAAIRARFAPLGGAELSEPIREPLPEPLDLG
jgi:hypothetical protein